MTILTLCINTNVFNIINHLLFFMILKIVSYVPSLFLCTMALTILPQIEKFDLALLIRLLGFNKVYSLYFSKVYQKSPKIFLALILFMQNFIFNKMLTNLCIHQFLTTMYSIKIIPRSRMELF